MTTTTFTSDYMGRDLVNPTPGTSDATDYVGRDVIPGDKDYLGRGLTGGPPPAAWAATTAYAVDDQVTLSGGAVLQCTVAGTSDATEPTPPGVGNTVVDGTVTWQQIA